MSLALFPLIYLKTLKIGAIINLLSQMWKLRFGVHKSLVLGEEARQWQNAEIQPFQKPFDQACSLTPGLLRKRMSEWSVFVVGGGGGQTDRKGEKDTHTHTEKEVSYWVERSGWSPPFLGLHRGWEPVQSS